MVEGRRGNGGDEEGGSRWIRGREKVERTRGVGDDKKRRCRRGERRGGGDERSRWR